MCRHIWIHEKTKQKYQLLGTALDAVTQSPVAIYKSEANQLVYTRPWDNFVGRFKEMKEEE